MSTTQRSDVVVPELLQEAIQSEFAGMTALAGSPCAIMNNSLPDSARGGDRVKVPYFDNLGELDDIAQEGDALTPRKLTMSSETALVQHSGVAFELTEWAQIAASYADPYKEAARQVAVATKRRADKGLIDCATSGLSSSYIKDVYSASVPRTIDYDMVVDAKMLWGDEQEDIELMAHHSKTLGDLLKLKTADGSPLLGTAQDGSPGNFVGIPRRTSDRLTPSSDSPPKYSTLLLKRNALVFWYCKTPQVQTDRDILADTQVAAVHVYWVAYRYARVAGGTKPGVIKIVHN